MSIRQSVRPWSNWILSFGLWESTVYDSQWGSMEVKKALFWHNHPWKSPKPWLGSKSFRSICQKYVKIFLGAPKNLFDPPKTLFGLKTSLLGGSYFKNFLIQAMVLEISRGDYAKKSAILPSVAPKNMTPPKVRFLRSKKVSRGQKSFVGPPKIKKNWFSQKTRIL